MQVCILCFAFNVTASHFHGAIQSSLGFVFTIITLEHKTGVVFPTAAESFMFQ